MKPTAIEPAIIISGNTTITTTHEGILNLPTLPLKARKARKANVFPTLGKSLLSITIICNTGDTAIFTLKIVTIYYRKTIVL